MTEICYLQSCQLFSEIYDHQFLFQCFTDKIKNALSDTVLDGFPGKLTPAEKSLCLIDIGYFVNNSGPPLLKPERNVDVIIAVDYDYYGIFKVKRNCFCGYGRHTQ